MSTTARFRVQGMDCASCATKIETAVKRIEGVEAAKIGLQSETLTVEMADAARSEAVEKAVASLGYRVARQATAVAPPRSPSAVDHSGHDNSGSANDELSSQAGHSDHGEAIDGPWWRSSKGVLVIITGVMTALAYLEHYILPFGSQYAFLAAALIGTAPVARRAFMALRNGSLFTIEMLMTIAVMGAIAIGATEEAAIVVFLFAVGELLEGVAAGRARSGIRALAKIAPQTAVVETPSGLVETPVAQLALGSIVVVRPGDRVPADGVIVSGKSALDESALTGESMPRSRGEGDMVLAGSINAESVLRVRVDKPAGDTLIARVVRLVEEAADAKAPSERFIERFARWYMPLICVLALAVALVPPLLWQSPWDVWIYRALTLLLRLRQDGNADHRTGRCHARHSPARDGKRCPVPACRGRGPFRTSHRRGHPQAYGRRRDHCCCRRLCHLVAKRGDPWTRPGWRGRLGWKSAACGQDGRGIEPSCPCRSAGRVRDGGLSGSRRDGSGRGDRRRSAARDIAGGSCRAAGGGGRADPHDDG